MTSVLILAAGSIKSKFNSFNPIFNSPGLISINCKTALSIIINYYQKKGIKNIYIAVNEADLSEVENELVSFKGFELIAIGKTTSITETLLYSLAKIPSQEKEILVTVTTTLPNILLEKNQILISDNEERNKYYSTVHFDDNGISFLSKENTSEITGFPFCGQFCGDIENIKSAVNLVVGSTDLLAVARQLYRKYGYEFIKKEWIDIGHEINYFGASAKILSSRSFNSLTLNEADSSITKRSTNIGKFIDEINYIRLLPQKLQLYFPRIIGETRVTETFAEATMEYYSYPNLGEYLLYKYLDEYSWDRIFSKFESILKEFQRNKFSIGKNAYRDFYLTKNYNRLDELNKDVVFAELMAKTDLQINGLKCLNIEALKPLIKQKIESLYDENDFSIMHGDLCFNNILYDFRGNILRLLDPRGSFGEQCVGIFGDIKYDLAKLAHSSRFHYDYIVNDLFVIEEKGDGMYEYSFSLRDNNDYIISLTDKLIVDLGYVPKNIYFIVGLLFISMTPLHSDNKKRQLIMFLHGLFILNLNLKNEETLY